MAQLYGKKTSDGMPRALECTDDGMLKVDTKLTATIDPTGLATEATLADVLAKIIAAPSTEAKQNDIIAALGLIATEATAGDIKTATEALAALISAGALAVSLGELPDTAAGDLADQTTALQSIDAAVPDLAADTTVQEVSDRLGALTTPAAGSTNKILADILAKIITAPATEATQEDVKTAVEALAVATPDTAAGDLASMSAALGTIQADIATVKADIATVASNSEITPATVTGTCTAAYATALSLACAGVRNKTIMVVNTDATLTMKYRIRGFAKSGSSYYNEIQAEATLAASTSQPHVIENSYDVITVEVIDGTGHATYAIDYCGGQ
jgi:hypothetical protein